MKSNSCTLITPHKQRSGRDGRVCSSSRKRSGRDGGVCSSSRKVTQGEGSPSLPTPGAVDTITSSPCPWSELSEETAEGFSSTSAALVL